MTVERILTAPVNVEYDARTLFTLEQMSATCDDQTRRRAHAKRMLARAERRSRQALKLVEKWQAKVAALDREGVAAKQAKLFADDLPECVERSHQSVL